MLTKSQTLHQDLTKSLARLKEALHAEPTPLHRDATVQRFEFTFEISWKLMQAILQENQIESYGVKSILREAARMKLIDDLDAWFKYLDARNRTSHTYKEQTAKKIYQEIKSFPPIVTALLKK